jgi:hypothetical protein
VDVSVRLEEEPDRQLRARRHDRAVPLAEHLRRDPERPLRPCLVIGQPFVELVEETG